MSEPDITALARRLAEQNNVDWRGLNGTGEGGKIVERDVLDYLARVMAGDEALDPTPEPLPEGMETWPDQDPALRQGGQATTLGELRQEIGSAVRDEPVPLGEAPEAAPPAAEVDEDVFLFEDEPQPTVEPTEVSVQAAGEAGATAGGEELEDLLVSGDDAGLLGDDDDVQPAGTFGAAAALGDDDSFDEDGRGDADQRGGAGWGDDIALGGHEHATQDEAPDIWGAPSAAAEPDVDLFADSVTAPTHDDDWSQDAGSAREDSSHDVWSQEVGAADEGSRETLWTQDEGDAQPAEGEPADRWASDETVAEPAMDADVAGQEGEEPAGEPVVEPAPDTWVGSEEPAPTWSQATTADAALSDAQGEPGGFAGIPLARTGTVLRRHVDVTALAGAQLAVSQELGHEEPLGAGPFVLRAVAKAARDQGVDLGQIALATFDGGLTLRRVDDAAGRPFAELVSELGGAGQEEDEAALVVADLSGLDLDEAVLDVDLPVVSLGRMLYDNQRGGYRSTLTLTGDLPAEQGARLLGRVAELLDAPVRLVM